MIVVYGMTVSPTMPFLMRAVLKNIDVKGSTMGSRREFGDMVRFVRSNKIHPVVSKVVKTNSSGLSDIASIDSLFEDMRSGSQFGKLVLRFGPPSNDDSKL